MPAPSPVPHLSPAELRENQGPQLLPVFIIFTILPVIALCLRLLARRITRMNLWWDDYLIVFASVCSRLAIDTSPCDQKLIKLKGLAAVQLALLVEGR